MSKKILRIFSLNTEYGKYSNTLVPYIESIREEFDVFCFQEVPNRASNITVFELEHDRHLFQKLEDVLRGFTSYYSEFVRESFGIATFVRDDLSQKYRGERFIFGNTYIPFLDHGEWNTATKAHIIKVGSVDVVNIHGAWQPGTKKLDTRERLIQSQILRDMTKKRQHKTVLIGDFNLMPDTRSVRILEKKYTNLIIQYGIKSTRTAVFDKPRAYADYAFVGSDLEVLDFRVHLEPIFSDHGFMTLDIVRT